KRVFLVILFTSFSGSLVSRIPGAVQNEHPHLPVESRRQAKGTRFLWQHSDKWMTESRQEKLIWLRAQMKLTSLCW
ncbi:hypothetical protein ACE41U_25685, partial [Shigella flexneri]|nr:hypothetical protein [Shigella sonnei]